MFKRKMSRLQMPTPLYANWRYFSETCQILYHLLSVFASNRKLNRMEPMRLRKIGSLG